MARPFLMWQILFFVMCETVLSNQQQLEDLKRLCPHRYHILAIPSDINDDTGLEDIIENHRITFNVSRKFVENLNTEEIVLENVIFALKRRSCQDKTLDFDSCWLLDDNEQVRDALTLRQPSYQSNVILYSRDTQSYTEVYTLKEVQQSTVVFQPIDEDDPDGRGRQVGEVPTAERELARISRRPECARSAVRVLEE